MDVGWCYLDSVTSSLHFCLQTSFLLTLLAQASLQLLLLLLHGLNAPLQRQHPTLTLDRQVGQTGRIPLTLTQHLIADRK